MAISRLQRNGLLALAAFAVVTWLLFRKASTTDTASGGHSSPGDAMSYGWAVFPRGITGWQEHGPNGEIINHETGGEGVIGIGVA